MDTLIKLIFNSDFFFGVLRLATPIIFASLAALVASNSGVVNMAIEGIMLFAALAAVIGSAIFGSVIAGILFAVLTGILISLLLAYFKIKMKSDEILAAIAINLLAAGATVFLLFLFSGERGTSSSIASKVVPSLIIPGLMDIPILGTVLLGQNLLVYVALISVVVIYYMLYKTPLGLRIRAVGGNPGAAESVGVSVDKIQYFALTISGVLAGLGGAFMTMGYLSIFTKGMISGRGFIGLAAANVGGQNPIGALVASLLFGFFDALGNNLQTFKIPVEFIFMIPYLTTIILYAASSYRRANKKLKKKIDQ